MQGACASTNTIPYPTLPEITVTQSQFECGPRARPLPSDEELKVMTTQEVLALYLEAWDWGYRCDKTGTDNYKYLKDAIERREEALQELQSRDS